MTNIPNKVSTFLWFKSQAAEAAALYCSIFPDSRITGSFGQATTFEIAGQRYVAFDGGPHFTLSAAVSIFVPCASQAEVDVLWAKFLDAGASETRCGWLVDRYGLSWQIIPTRLLELMHDPDEARAQRVVQAMLKMQKIDVATLERA